MEKQGSRKPFYRIRTWAVRVALITIALIVLFPGIWPEAHKSITQLLGAVLQIGFYMALMIVQFVAMFWFLSRGRQTVVLPGDPAAVDFSQYWGQDELVERVRIWLEVLRSDSPVRAMGGRPIHGMLLFGKPGPQPLTARVLTPQGWTTMGELGVGDLVIGRDGKSTKVINVADMGKQEVYRVTFSDGRSTRATANHVWGVFTNKDRVNRAGPRLKNTSELRYGCGRGKAPDAVPVPLPAQFPRKDLLIDPYVLGLLIGDGYLVRMGNSIQYTSSDSYLPGKIRRAGYDVRKRNSSIQWAIYEIADDLDSLGLLGKKSPQKFIPEMYMAGSVEQRLELLRGLMDTDGHGGKRGRLSWSSTSERLAKQFIELVRSLGGYAHIQSVDSRAPNSVYGVVFGLYGVDVLSNPTKVAKFEPRKTSVKYVFIDRVEPDGVEAVRCIGIDRPDGLYITDEYVVTHNSGKTLLAKAMASEAGVPFIGLEGGSLKAMFVGVDVLKIWSLFRKAKNLARQYPHNSAIIYIDEIDAIAMSRGGVMGEQGSQSQPVLKMIVGGGMGGGFSGALSTLLSQMDGLDDVGRIDRILSRILVKLGKKPIEPPNLFIMGSTNRPDVLDPALTRSGRLDKKIEVPFPDATGRGQIFRGYLDKVQHDEIDLGSLVEFSSNMSPADIAQAVTRDAPSMAIRDGRHKITQKDIVLSLIESHVGVPNPIRGLPDKQREQIAYHEAGHAIAVHLLMPQRIVAFVTIVRTGTALGYMLPTDLEELHAFPLEALVSMLEVALAGHEAALIWDGKPWTGGGGDFHYADALVKTLAANRAYDTIYIPGGPVDGELRKLLDRQVEHSTKAVRDLLKDNWRLVEAVAAKLLKSGSLDNREFIKVVEATSDKSGKEG